jgi:hypothetical protein
MQRYFVEIPSANSGSVAKDAVQFAFEDQAPLYVEGSHESVEVNFDLLITRYTRAREGAKVMLRFSGVISPKNEPFVAEFNEESEGSPMIDVTTRPIASV